MTPREISRSPPRMLKSPRLVLFCERPLFFLATINNASDVVTVYHDEEHDASFRCLLCGAAKEACVVACNAPYTVY